MMIEHILFIVMVIMILVFSYVSYILLEPEVETTRLNITPYNSSKYGNPII